MAKKQPEPTKIYTLKITLKDSNPPIWRRVQVPDTMSLGRLHEVILMVMGWDGYHLHEFLINKQRYGRKSMDDMFGDGPDFEEFEFDLGDILTKKRQKFVYIYDFGDDWIHDIVVEAIDAPEPGAKYPVCLDGKLACPPEDCGGLWGYYELLEILKDPNHQEYEDRVEWLGGGFDPEAFDIKSINKKLSKIRK